MPTRPPHSPFFASLGDVQADSRAPPARRSSARGRGPCFFWRPPSPIMPVGTADTLHTRHSSHSHAGRRVVPPRIVVFMA